MGLWRIRVAQELAGGTPQGGVQVAGLLPATTTGTSELEAPIEWIPRLCL